MGTSIKGLVSVKLTTQVAVRVLPAAACLYLPARRGGRPWPKATAGWGRTLWTGLNPPIRRFAPPCAQAAMRMGLTDCPDERGSDLSNYATEAGNAPDSRISALASSRSFKAASAASAFPL